jgi:hypothetical protein
MIEVEPLSRQQKSTTPHGLASVRQRDKAQSKSSEPKQFEIFYNASTTREKENKNR